MTVPALRLRRDLPSSTRIVSNGPSIVSVESCRLPPDRQAPVRTLGTLISHGINSVVAVCGGNSIILPVLLVAACRPTLQRDHFFVQEIWPLEWPPLHLGKLIIDAPDKTGLLWYGGVFAVTEPAPPGPF